MRQFKIILVTGGCGFIGSNFIHYMLKTYSDLKIINLDKLTYAGNLKNHDTLSLSEKERFGHTTGDINSLELVRGLFKSYDFDAVIHFAAESHVDRSIEKPQDFITTNINGTTSLLIAANEYYQKTKNKNFIFHHVSTDEVYGSLENDGTFFTETTNYDPSSPYSASKAASDHLVRAWNRTFGLPITISNCSNNYGPFQFPEKLIPLVIQNCLEYRNIPIYGNGLNIRDWLHVEDHCRAIDFIIQKSKIGETYNIGGNNELTNIQVVDKICSIVGKKTKKDYIELITYVKDRPGHDKRYAIDSSKIKKDLSWVPIETFDSGFEKTIDWYLNNQRWVKDLNYSRNRIG